MLTTLSAKEREVELFLFSENLAVRTLFAHGARCTWGGISSAHVDYGHVARAAAYRVTHAKYA
jgi:hypothetical protein